MRLWPLFPLCLKVHAPCPCHPRLVWHAVVPHGAPLEEYFERSYSRVRRLLPFPVLQEDLRHQRMRLRYVLVKRHALSQQLHPRSPLCLLCDYSPIGVSSLPLRLGLDETRTICEHRRDYLELAIASGNVGHLGHFAHAERGFVYPGPQCSDSPLFQLTLPTKGLIMVVCHRLQKEGADLGGAAVDGLAIADVRERHSLRRNAHLSHRMRLHPLPIDDAELVHQILSLGANHVRHLFSVDLGVEEVHTHKGVAVGAVEEAQATEWARQLPHAHHLPHVVQVVVEGAVLVPYLRGGARA
mmetsp:Transcript_30195/g.54012  ORF Transcript_30195/g.54012 Transcript_30195/m.54012 type:complete len:298 (-) Transcript_30195:165-1058(-)